MQRCAHIHPIGWREEAIGFSLELRAKEACDPSILPHIREGANALIKDNLPLHRLTMERKNAQDRLRAQGSYEMAQFLPKTGHVLLMQLEGWALPVESFHVKKTGEISSLTLDALIPLSGGGFRLYGYVGKVKAPRSLLRVDPKRGWRGGDYRILGSSSGLFSCDAEGGIIWPESLLYSLYSSWRRHYIGRGFRLVIPPLHHLSKEHKGAAFSNIQSLVAETDRSSLSEAWIPCRKGDMCDAMISSLKFIEQIPKMSGIDYYLQGKYRESNSPNLISKTLDISGSPSKLVRGERNAIEVQMISSLGKKRAGPSIVCEGVGIRESLYGHFPTLVAALLEGGGKLEKIWEGTL
ncbi:MAG: hypothetical protein VXZ72_01150 [Chlamydiota bacterium]|nr:hypothetical protein [Chlamydiota bacterium]